MVLSPSAYSPSKSTNPIDNTDYTLNDAFMPTGAKTTPERSSTGGATAPDPGAGNNPFAPSGAQPGSGSSQPGVVNDPYAPAIKHLTEASQNLESAYAAPHSGGFRQVLGALLSRRNPEIGGIVSGETQRNRGIQQAQQDYGIASNELGAARAQQNQIVENKLKGAQADEATAKGNQATAEAAALPAKQALEAAQTEGTYYKEDPNYGLIDTRTGKPVAGGDAALAPLTAAEAQVLGKNPGDRVPLKLKNTANEIANRGITTVNTEGGVYERNRQTGSMTRLGDNPRMMFSPDQQYTPTLDPDNPSKVILQKRGVAASTGAALPQSAEGITARATARAVAPGGKVGEEINAYNTAIQHGDLLKKAITSLNNGDIQTLNGLKNSFNNEFGGSGPVTAQAIADAYTRETTKMLSSGHLTDSEISTIGKTLDPMHQSPQQMNSVISAYQSLANSKMKVRQQGVERGMRGEANFPTDSGSPQGSGAATHRFNPSTGQIEAIQ